MMQQQKALPNHFITIKHQKILIFMLGKNKLKFKEQNIYKANNSFKRAMNQLEKINFIRIERPQINKGCNIYSLTFDGRILTNEIFKDFNDRNK
jgi:hypothetical protein